ncbi:MAG TPA: class I SAM-dependent methyltransferase [Acetobacteraceae bacterium]|jgi:predicted O-methyltransferase YrrM
MSANWPLIRRDYVSPGFQRIHLDACFPEMMTADPATCTWPYLRHGPHLWYGDRRFPGTGFLNRDEVHILYNTALRFEGRPALEIGCFMGWSTCHLAAAGVDLDVIDPILGDTAIRDSITTSMTAAGIVRAVRMHATTSPDGVTTLGRLGMRWSLIFIDGDHEFPAPVRDAVIGERYAAVDALIMFHDLNAPAVAEGLYYLRDRGWDTRIYHTSQIMGVAWRGAVSPVDHVPDRAARWPVPEHLRDLV